MTTTSSAAPGTSIHARQLSHYLTSAPAVSDAGDVYVCSLDGKLRKLNYNGEEQWQAANMCGTLVIPCTDDCHPDGQLASPAIIPSDGGDQYGRFGGHIVITGEDWMTRIIDGDGTLQKSLCSHPDRLTDDSCAGVRISTGPVQPKVGSVTVTRNGWLVVPSAESTLVAWSLTSLKEVWRYRLPANTDVAGAAQAVAQGGELVVASTDGHVHVLGALPYMSPTAASDGRLNAEWTFVGVPDGVAASLHSDNITSLRVLIAKELLGAGAASVKTDDVLISRLTRTAARRAETIGIALTVRVRAVSVARIVAAQLGEVPDRGRGRRGGAAGALEGGPG